MSALNCVIDLSSEDEAEVIEEVVVSSGSDEDAGPSGVSITVVQNTQKDFSGNDTGNLQSLYRHLQEIIIESKLNIDWSYNQILVSTEKLCRQLVKHENKLLLEYELNLQKHYFLSQKLKKLKKSMKRQRKQAAVSVESPDDNLQNMYSHHLKSQKQSSEMHLEQVASEIQPFNPTGSGVIQQKVCREKPTDSDHCKMQSLQSQQSSVDLTGDRDNQTPNPICFNTHRVRKRKLKYQPSPEDELVEAFNSKIDSLSLEVDEMLRELEAEEEMFKEEHLELSDNDNTKSTSKLVLVDINKLLKPGVRCIKPRYS